MYYYKSFRYIDGKVILIITDENDNIIQNSTKEQIKVAIYEDIKKRRFDGRICCVCRSNKTYIKNTGSPQWFKCICNKKGCTKWLCNKCYQKYNPDSSNNIIKHMRKCRVGASISTDTSKGIITEAVIAKVRHLNVVCIEENNLGRRLDLSRDPEYGIIQVKGRKLRYDKNNGYVWGFDSDGVKYSDTTFIFCMDESWKNVERIYAIPSDKIACFTGFAIYKNPLKGDKYREFIIKDIIEYVDTYRDLLSYLENKKNFTIKDIKEWLEL